MLLDGNRGYIGWGRARAYDFILSLQWLLENRSRYAGVSLGSDGHSPNHKSNVALLIDTMELISEHAFDWADFFSESSFPKGDLDAIGWDREYDYVHVVNVGQGIDFADDSRLLEALLIGSSSVEDGSGRMATHR